jgi:DNA-binding transcriptional regulator YiaG
MAQTNRDQGSEVLLEELRAQRKLPPAEERKQIREAAGVSIRRLAAALGVSPMAPIRWEQGAMPRKPEHVHEYAELLAEMRRLAGNGGSS